MGSLAPLFLSYLQKHLGASLSHPETIVLPEGPQNVLLATLQAGSSCYQHRSKTNKALGPMAQADKGQREGGFVGGGHMSDTQEHRINSFTSMWP